MNVTTPLRAVATRRFEAIKRAERLESNGASSAVALGARIEADEAAREMRRLMPGCDGVMRGMLLGRRPHDFAIETRAMGATARTAVDLVTFGSFFGAALMARVPLVEVASTVTTSQGGEYAYSYLKSVASTTAIVSDGATLTSAAPVFGGVSTAQLFKYPYYESVSEELFRDTYVNLEELWATSFAAQAVASLDVDLWAGAGGSSAPEGLTAGVTSGVTAASATVLAVDDVAAALAALADQYVNPNTSILLSPDAFWDLSRQTLGTSAAGGQAWDVSSGHGTLFGFRVRRESQLAVTATGNVVAVVGDFTSGYLVRLMPARIEVSSESGFSNNQFGIRCILRADGRLLNAATALRKITMA